MLRYNATFILQDFGREGWIASIKETAPFDLIVSGFAIHHQPDDRKKDLYGEIFDLLKPDGLFLNLEHVVPVSDWAEAISDELFIDLLFSFHQKKGSQKPKEQIAEEWMGRADKAANILTSVETQCEWLKQIGFVDVGCFFKIFELALFGGMKPTE